MTMPITRTHPAPTTPPVPHREAGGWAAAVRLAGAGALVVGPVVFALGMATSPQAAGTSDADYVASLARDLTQTQVSALLLHYGNLLLGLGVLAAPSLVRGARGLKLTVVGALAAALAFTNMSGSLLSDWWNAAGGTVLGAERGAEVFAGFKDGSLLGWWTGTEPLCLLGPVLLLVGLARAGVVAWWSVALYLSGIVGFIALSNGLPILAAGALLAGLTPLTLVGVRVVQRQRLTVPA